MARRKKVLCVSPSSPPVDELAKLLKEAGFAVLTARSFRSAIVILRPEKPDAILLDENYSLVDGLWSLDIIKSILPAALVILVNFNNGDFTPLVQAVAEKLGGVEARGASGS